MVARANHSYGSPPPYRCLTRESPYLSEKLRTVQLAAEAASAHAHQAATQDMTTPRTHDLVGSARLASIHAAEAAFRMNDASRGVLDARIALALARQSLTEAQGAIDAAWSQLEPEILTEPEL